MNKFIVALIILSVCGFIAIFPLLVYTSDEYLTIKISDKERITEDEDGKYIIFTEEEVFENTDSLWYWKFNSSDFYSQLEIGQEYDVRVYWYRVPFLSMYRNIIEIK